MSASCARACASSSLQTSSASHPAHTASTAASSIGVARRDGLHLEIVGEEHAFEAELGAQRLAQIDRDSVAGTPGSIASYTTCAVMSEAMPAPMAARNGGDRSARAAFARCAHDGQIVVAVEPRVAVPGEVLAAREHVGLLQPAHVRDAEAHHGARSPTRTRDRR